MLLERKGMLSDTPFKLFLYLFCSFISYVSSYSDSANVSQSWINKVRLDHGENYSFIENSHTRTILFTNSFGLDSNVFFGFGFVEQQLSSTSSLLCTYRQTSNDGGRSYPLLIWCANRDHPVQENATLDLTLEGDLVLRDADGSFVWSTKTSGHSVKYMQLDSFGSLGLLIAKNVSIWESSNYPTDTISQIFAFYDDFIGKKLKSSISSTNYCTGIYTVSFESDGLHAYVDLNISQEYYFLDNQNFINLFHRQFDFEPTYIRLDPDGNLNHYVLRNSTLLSNLFKDSIFGKCTQETCGDYGICFSDSKCYCPMRNDDSLEYFKPKDALKPNLGCNRFTSLSCPDTDNLQSFLELVNVTYFNTSPFLIGKDVESCKRECLSSCSCKAVIFFYYNDSSSGNCTLPSEIHTLMDVSNARLVYNTNAYIKVQNTKQLTTISSNNRVSIKRKLAVYVSVSLAALIFFIGVCISVLIRRRKSSKDIDFSDDIVVDTVSRFSLESLKIATEDFKTRLGRGGFGTVFEGTLEDGTKVAVKQLNSSGQGRKEFLAEVNTIGSLHHFNLVRLIGFCDDGSNRLLVYEYMCNGSLEKWIFNTDIPQRLTWNIRRSIINGVASGLEYLHEHCKQNVIHFDIKPQNILLDKDFNIKISDFGLAKMVDRDQSQVMTIVRGTPGYMAPELISGQAISVKVDVYSFGVVVLEIVCGRKNFGSSEGDCLTNLVKAKANLDQLTDLIDEHDPDVQQNKEEMVKMMKIAIRCLQPHFIRPTMPMVVKVLQDLPNMEAISDLSYLTMYNEAAPMEANRSFSVCPTDSILSGPR